MVVKEGCEASRNPRDWWGETRPSPPAHQSEWQKQFGHLLRGAQIPQSVDVGPSICRIVLPPGSHRLGPAQTGSHHQGSCRTLSEWLNSLMVPSGIVICCNLTFGGRANEKKKCVFQKENVWELPPTFI